LKLLFALAALCASGVHARALDYKQIAGRWCLADLGVIEFTPTEMRLHFEKTGERRVYVVEEYHPHGEALIAHWRWSEKKDFTAFGNLRSGGTQLTQLASENGPAREMERCVVTIGTKPNPGP
jgi:hypothetical protein